MENLPPTLQWCCYLNAHVFYLAHSLLISFCQRIRKYFLFFNLRKILLSSNLICSMSIAHVFTIIQNICTIFNKIILHHVIYMHIKYAYMWLAGSKMFFEKRVKNENIWVMCVYGISYFFSASPPFLEHNTLLSFQMRIQFRFH